MAIVIIGIDLGMNSCSLGDSDPAGRIVLRRRLRRGSLEGFGFARTLGSVRVRLMKTGGMEASRPA
jgi:hypothetical protein